MSHAFVGHVCAECIHLPCSARAIYYIFHAVIQPYENRRINMLDTFIGASLSEPHTYVKYATAVCMCIYIYKIICIYVPNVMPYSSIYTEWTRWPPFASPFACYSNTRHGQLQTRRKSYDTKRKLQPLTQARTQASYERIAPTNLPPRSRI